MSQRDAFLGRGELFRGAVVKSIAGHDAGSFYVVLAVFPDTQRVTIADGRRRKAERMPHKQKNIRHLAVTSHRLEEASLATDKKIRQALWTLNCSNHALDERKGFSCQKKI